MTSYIFAAVIGVLFVCMPILILITCWKDITNSGRTVISIVGVVGIIGTVFSLLTVDDHCHENHFQNISKYVFTKTHGTKSGIEIDLKEVNKRDTIDLGILDTRINLIVSCIKDVGNNIGTITDQEKAKWACVANVFDIKFIDQKLKCLKVKVVEPILSKCSEWQFLDLETSNDQPCLDKGIKPTRECPCRWRTAIQDDCIVVTPTALYLWDIGRALTSCNNIWVSPFAKCLDY